MWIVKQSALTGHSAVKRMDLDDSSNASQMGHIALEINSKVFSARNSLDE